MNQFIAKSSIVCSVSILSAACLGAFVVLQEPGDDTVDRRPAVSAASPFFGQLHDGPIPRPGEFTPQFFASVTSTRTATLASPTS